MMRLRIGTAVLGTVTALAMLALLAGAASAVTVRDAVTNTTLAVGASVNAATTSGAPLTLSGTFLGNPTNTTCDSTLSGTVAANPSSSGNDWLSIESYTWTNCHGIGGAACTTPAANLPWTPNTSPGAGGGLEATSQTAVNFGMGNGYIDLTSCWNITCQITGGSSTTPLDGTFELAHYFGTTWTNGAAEQMAINTSNIVGTASSSCFTTSPTLKGNYRFTDSAGNAIALGP